jgi:hypothetical protein
VLAPIVLSVGLDLGKLTRVDDLASAAALLLSKWMLFVWAIVAIGILLTVLFMLHSFVQAGAVRVYVEAERAAGPALVRPRAFFRVFSMERWLAGGKEGWRVVFWIYTLVSTLGLAILLVPLLPTLVLLLLLKDGEPGPALAVGCLGIAVTVMLAVLAMIVGGIWCNRAIVTWAVQRTDARASLRGSWAAIRADFGRHFLIALAVFVVALAGSTFFGGFSFVAGVIGAAGGRNSAALQLITLPIRLFTTLLSSAFSAAVTSWFVAAYASLAVE